MQADIWTITSLALVDSINPCTIAVQAILLSSLLLSKGRKEAVIGGLLFVVTIYVMYLLYGLGILQVLYMVGIQNILLPILVVLLVLMAAAELSAYIWYRPGMVSLEMPMALRPYAKKFLNMAHSPILAIPIAVLCSILLLPCSSGPYVSALMILARQSWETVLPILLYYNLIFVLPMVAITLLVGWGLSPKGVLQWREKHIRELHLLSGLLLLLVLFLLLTTS